MSDTIKIYLLYSKDNCPLCEQAERLVRQYVDESELEIVDIIGNEDLENQYIFRIPVLVSGQQVIAEGCITPEDLERIRDRSS